MADVFSAVFAIARGRLNDAGQRWLDAAIATTRGGDVNRLAGNYTAASRQAGVAPLGADAAERASLAAIAPGLSCEHWTVADAARAALLLASAQESGDERRFVHAALTCFENGDAREQQSWLRAVSLLPHHERFTAVAVDACRSHIQPTFEAIACENPYASIRFSERQFNQMVLKAMFTGVRLERIVALDRRVNPDLSQMARDYAAERRAAGRSVPPDLALALHDAPALEEHLS